MFAIDIRDQTLENENFRKVLHTGEHTQLVAMCLEPGEDIGLEIHKGADQILVFVSGEAEVVVNDETSELQENDVVVVPAGAEHNVTNAGTKALKLFTIYGPRTHKGGTVHRTKTEAEVDPNEG